MPNKPKISVVMGVYNEEKNIKKSINNILNHYIDNIEVILIDDGSDDSTVEMINSMESEKIRLIKNDENRGLAYSLNRGIDCARGEYIARMDADDISVPGRLAKQSNVLDENPGKKVVGCWCGIINKSGKRMGVQKYSVERNDTPQSFKESFDGPAHPSVMMRRSSLLKVGKYREEFKYAQDIDLWVRMSRQFGNNFIHMIPEVLYNLRKTINHFSTKSIIKSRYANFAGEADIDGNKLNVSINKEVNYNKYQKREAYHKWLKKLNCGEDLTDYYMNYIREIIFRNMSRVYILTNKLRSL